MGSRFVHLSVHSEYSLSDGIATIKGLHQAAATMAMPALAITDRNNLFAAVKFYKAALSAGVKPIIGVDLTLINDEQQRFQIKLYCQNNTGYFNLLRLVSRAYMDDERSDEPCVQLAWLEQLADGLIALSAGIHGDVGHALIAGHTELARQRLQYWQRLFPQRFYIEISRLGRDYEADYTHAVLPLARDYQLPLIATNDVCFIAADDFAAHEARVCIYQGDVLSDTKRKQIHTDKQYFRNPDEMVTLFADIPSALQNTVEMAKRCNVFLDLEQVHLPDFPVPVGVSVNDYLVEVSKQGLQQRVVAGFLPAASGQATELYQTRLAVELEVITKMGFAGYFLIVADFIQWSKDNGVPVGPGRGSGAGSLVAFALEITDIDPLKYDLLFERFLNPERVSMPDFDIDFCMDGRDRVIEYVANKYGANSVSQIITYGSMAAKAVIRDVGRVMGYPYGFVDQIAKLIPFELGITLDKALQQEEQFKQRYSEEDDVRALVDMARKLEGIKRNVSKHAGGVVIAPAELYKFAPVYREAGSSGNITQFDKDDVETIGLVKFDFLGLRTLTIIDWAVQAINQQRLSTGEAVFDISHIPLDDAATFKLLKACKTTAVFQLESRGMKDLIKRLQPDCFEEIIALVALFRPGPLQSGMVDDFIDRKHGRASVTHLHPKIESILKPTYGVILYQEQVMQIAQILAGYTLGGADILRRAMGKKKPDEMAKQREIFVSGAVKLGVDEVQAVYIFDLMEKFSGYGFNKSHSAAYALIAYQTAWLKCHYPAEFMAAVLSSDMDNTDKVVAFYRDCQQLQLEITPPHVNLSQYKFTSQGQQIIYGLGAIKGLGEAAIESIVIAREQNGAFKDLQDFCFRIDTQKVNRRGLEALIKAGALDNLGQSRQGLLNQLESALLAAEQASRNIACGQDDLFATDAAPALVQSDTVAVPEMAMQALLTGEKETLGLYFSGHPFAEFETELNQIITAPIANLKPSGDQSVMIAGIIVGIRTMQTKRGDRMAFITVQDRTASIEVAVFAKTYNANRDLIVKDQTVIIEGDASVDDYTGGYRVRCEQIYNLAEVRAKFGKRLLIKVGKALDDHSQQQLKTILTAAPRGDCPVFIAFKTKTSRATCVLGERWHVAPDQALLQRLADQYGEGCAEIEYV